MLEDIAPCTQWSLSLMSSTYLEMNRQQYCQMGNIFQSKWSFIFVSYLYVVLLNLTVNFHQVLLDSIFESFCMENINFDFLPIFL